MCTMVLNVRASTVDKCVKKDSIYEETEHVSDTIPKYSMNILLRDIRTKMKIFSNRNCNKIQN